MASIVYCEIVEEKTSGRSSFRVLHDTGTDFKTHEFEADTDIASKLLFVLPVPSLGVWVILCDAISFVSSLSMARGEIYTV